MDQSDWVTGELVLSINGEPLKIQMTVPAKPVKPHRMLPVFQKMTNTFVEMSAVGAGGRGETVSCRQGCAACCRQPVPISEVEIYYLAEVVEAMPEPRRSEIKNKFKDKDGAKVLPGVAAVILHSEYVKLNNNRNINPNAAAAEAGAASNVRSANRNSWKFGGASN